MSRDAHWSVLERLSHSAHLKYIFSSFLSVSSRNASQTPADRPRNELDEEEETVQTLQYSQDQVHQSGTALGLMARLVMIVNSDRWRKMAMKTLGVRRPSEGVFLIASRRGIGSVVRESYGGRGGRAQVVDPSRKSRGRRTTVVQRSLKSVVKESRRRRAVWPLHKVL